VILTMTTKQTTNSRLQEVGDQVREALGFADESFVDAIDLLDRAVGAGFIARYDVVEDTTLPDVEAHWRAEDRSITLRRSIHSNAAAEEVRSRFTIAHELAHAVLGHPTRNRKVAGALQFGRSVTSDEIDADELAAAILAPLHLIDLSKHHTPQELANDFGMPIKAAERQFILLQNTAQHSGRRRAVLSRSGRAVAIDTGSYEDAFWAMSRNAERSED
jgi:hypothetical protein